MKRTFAFYSAACLAVGLLFAATVAGRAAVFLKLDGIDGEARDTAHAGWIDVSALQWHMRGPAGTNATRLSALGVAKSLDAATPLLQLACATGKHFPKVTLDFARTGPRTVRFYRIILNDARVVSNEGAGEPGVGPRPVEQVVIEFERIEWIYHEFALDGAPSQEWSAYWDRVAGKGDLSVAPPMSVSGTPAAAGGGITVAFSGRAGSTYRVLGSPDPFGPYREVRRITLEADGPASASLPAGGPGQFYVVEEAP